MWEQRQISIIHFILSFCFLFLSIILFLAINFNPYLYPDNWLSSSTPDATSVYPYFRSFVNSIVDYTQNPINALYMFIGPAIHLLYIVLFSWFVITLDRNYPVSYFQYVVGLPILIISCSAFSEAFYMFWTGTPDEKNSVGFHIVSGFLVPHFGLLPSVIVLFMCVLMGLILCMDWLFIYLVHLSVSMVRLCWYGTKRLIKGVKDTIDWINTHIISLEPVSLDTESPVEQLPLPLDKESEKILPDLLSPNASYLPDLPVIANTESEEKNASQSFTFPSHFQAGVKQLVSFFTGNNNGHDEHESYERPVVEEKASDKGLTYEEKTSTADYLSNDFKGEESMIHSRKPSKFRNDYVPPVRSEIQYPDHYTKPPLTLLVTRKTEEAPDYQEKLQERARILVQTLERFGVKAQVTGITCGPTVTRFELEPEPGIKVTRFLSHADDITLALKAERVRVEAPIPGKGKVGIEVPNPTRKNVYLKELLESPVLSKHRGKLRLPLGKDIAGEVKVADLTQMPHLLIAGATGSGKTVFMKALIASLLFQYTPDELRLVLIDPKMVEFSIFNDIPHLLEPVVTDAKKAYKALDVLVKEMERRYALFANTNTRNIEIFNRNVENGHVYQEREDLFTEPDQVSGKLPYIVCIIDELADLMMVNRGKENVEEAIARLSQLARAVGIHLIVATQRPSVNVITGVIKANFPARISFQVSSKVDSRCILDTIGAEKLIGYGDMLYHNAGSSKPVRIQGAYVSDEEIEALVNYLKTQAPPEYLNYIDEDFSEDLTVEDDSSISDDEYYEEAVRLVCEMKQASVSLLQRRLGIGYARAGRLIDMMERRGIVGPHRGSKPREVLICTNNVGNSIQREYNNEIYPSEEEDN